ncbi:enterobactin synthase subunit EntD [Lelliottia sp. V106_10]|uniref:enterobactin synthase subunit EntD n=1 Tax=Lelliottia wanjuensis TaxID=3050585 RepID=UPI00254DBDAD|nr:MULTISPECIES: enterobactin synthase subunit EntD [unclassified Lelliottia]MDK9358622.1 enterobactin synthase subunit EntD [Lelliottia sp. V106_16]MDK9376102.1 enterobactin synthase subunit EntD [Lelliottia sp. V106_10]MDK9602677.1 enterobactin synthase subunit EntD [Lelliottia sp. V106_5]
MQTTHSLLTLGGVSLHRIDFDPTTFDNADLLWLPHHAALSHAATKRKADHLAGRIAAAHALQDLAIATVPGIGPNGEPLWPAGVAGSISHSGTQAFALTVRRENALVGIDGEQLIDEQEAVEIQDGIICAEEKSVLLSTGYPFSLALTLAFSAKESLFKALFPRVNAFMGFDSAWVTAISDSTLTLSLTRPLAGFSQNHAFILHWCQKNNSVITLLCE